MYEKYAKIRDEKGYKDSQIASLTGISKATFSQWKRGDYNPKMDKLAKICDVLGMSLDYLLYGNIDDDPTMLIIGQKAKTPEHLAYIDSADSGATIEAIYDMLKNSNLDRDDLEMLKSFVATTISRCQKK